MVNAYFPKDYKPKLPISILDLKYMIMLDNEMVYICRYSKEVSDLLRNYPPLGCRFTAITRIEHKKIYTTLRDFEENELNKIKEIE